jgi:hypothetical protein
MRSLGFTDIILSAALWPRNRLNLQQKWVPEFLQGSHSKHDKIYSYCLVPIDSLSGPEAMRVLKHGLIQAEKNRSERRGIGVSPVRMGRNTLIKITYKEERDSTAVTEDRQSLMLTSPVPNWIAFRPAHRLQFTLRHERSKKFSLSETFCGKPVARLPCPEINIHCKSVQKWYSLIGSSKWSCLQRTPYRCLVSKLFVQN